MSNKNKDRNETFQKLLDETKYVVEATAIEQYFIWRETSNEAIFRNPEFNIYDWRQHDNSYEEQIGQIKNGEKVFPVMLFVSFVRINGVLIAFVDAISRVVDYKMVTDWLDENCNPKHKGRMARTDAMNFSRALHCVNDLNKVKA